MRAATISSTDNAASFTVSVATREDNGVGACGSATTSNPTSAALLQDGVRLTLGAPVQWGQCVELSFSTSSGSWIKDRFGNSVAAFSNRVVPNYIERRPQILFATVLAGRSECTTGSCDICLIALPDDGGAGGSPDCPSVPPNNCNTVSEGALCVGAGLCGSNTGLDNCGTMDIYRHAGVDIAKRIMLVYDMSMDHSYTDAGDWSVGGAALTVSAVSVAGNVVMLKTNAAIGTGTSITVSYNPDSDSDFLQSTAGRHAAAVAAHAVQNRATQTTPTLLGAFMPVDDAGKVVLVYDETGRSAELAIGGRSPIVCRSPPACVWSVRLWLKFQPLPWSEPSSRAYVRG